MTGPVLSNFLADLAERIGEHVGRYRRSTLTAESALEAGRLLVEARAECRHGEWLAFLERAGLADRTARNWRSFFVAKDALNIVDPGDDAAKFVQSATDVLPSRVADPVERSRVTFPHSIPSASHAGVESAEPLVEKLLPLPQQIQFALQGSATSQIEPLHLGLHPHH